MPPPTLPRNVIERMFTIQKILNENALGAREQRWLTPERNNAEHANYAALVAFRAASFWPKPSTRPRQS